MLFSGVKRIIKSGLAMGLAGAVFLLPVENALADATIGLNQNVTTADPARLNAYMDSGGTWDGNNEITQNNGDIFTLSVSNTASNAAIAANTAYDVSLTLNVDQGIMLPLGHALPPVPDVPDPFLVTVTPIQLAGTACPALGAVTATQPTGVGGQIVINLPANTDIRPQCRYDFTFELTTTYAPPFALDGNRNFTYTANWTNQDGTPLNPVQISNFTFPVQAVSAAQFAITKTVSPTTPTAVDGTPVQFDVLITNTGDGGLFEVDLTDTLASNLSGIQLTVPPAYTPPVPGPGDNTFTFDYMDPGQSIAVTVDSTADITPDDTTCSVTNIANVVDRTGLTATSFDTVPYDLSNHLTVSHDLASSYCLLCGQGEVVLRVRNTGGITLTNINVAVNLSAAFPLESGLTYAPLPTPASVTVITGPATTFAMGAPTLSGPNDSTVNFNLNVMGSPLDGTPSEPSEVEIRFFVERATAFGFDLEGLAIPALTNLSIESTATFDSVCGPNPAPITTGIQTLPLRQPVPVVNKLGWNVDAGQDISTAAPVVFGHEDDDIIWQVEVTNTNSALAGLEDLLVNDTIGGNFDFIAVCDNEGDATTTATSGVLSGSCVARSGLTATPYEPAANPDIPLGTATGSVFYVGRILATCTDATNTADIEWGCEANVPVTPGGLNSTNTTVGTDLDTAILNTNVSGADLAPGLSNQLNVNVEFTGTHPTNFGATTQPPGSRGRVTITITNDTGGTVRNIDLLNVLPVGQYVVDPTIPTVATTATNTPEFDITITPANGVASYPGMIDRVTWTNPVAIVDPTTDPLGNTSPQFTFDSTTSGPGGDEYRDNMLRHGDVLTMSFDVVLVESSRYDLTADLDVPEEINPGADPDTNAPTGFAINNQLTVTFENACDVPDRRSLPLISDNFNAFPEDIDLEIIDPVSGNPSLEFILNTNSAITLPLRVQLINNGGHDALDYFAVVTFGDAMQVVASPPNCTDVSSPQNLPRPYWDQPVPIPPEVDSPTVYQCDYEGFGAIAPGAALNLDFTVSRNDTATVDDLTFRVDVVGEIQLSDRSAANLSDGTALVFPPVTNTFPPTVANVANNYTLDGLRAKVIGFGLTKDPEGPCTEAASFPLRDADAVFIGEDCMYKIRSGGWFGFDTPGFGIIAVHNITVTDALPNGQGFISQTDGGPTTVGGGSDPEILDILFGSGTTITRVPPPAAVAQLTEGAVSWNFNPPATSKLTDKDKFFRTDITTRILNDQLDLSAAPNFHAAPSINTVDTTFDADFAGGVFSFGPTTPGYPALSLREETLTVTEPNLVITKEVCNETLQLDSSCDDGDFSQTVNNGDTEDFYVYRIRIVNQDDSAGAAPSRAPAYNVVVVDTLDGSDLMQVHPVLGVPVNPLTDPFNNDGLDNDGDGVDESTIGESDEAVILTDNIVNDSGNINPAVIKFSYTTSTALAQIDPGETVDLFYRVNPDDFIAPLQILTNRVDVKYDSLEGLAGNQNPTQFPVDPDTYPAVNTAGSAGSARVYTDLEADNPSQFSSVQILPLAVEPKVLVQTSLNLGAGPLPDLTDVRVGEEVEYRLRTLIPVANLRQFTVRDELPPGIRCIDVPEVDLGAAPYSAAGFVPGGVFNVTNGNVTCTENMVEWRFGDQELTAALGNMRFQFEVSFTARVENTATTNVTPFNPGVNNCIIRNGGAGTGDSWSSPPATYPTPLNDPVPPTQDCDQDTFVRTSYVNDPTQGSQLIEHFFSPIQIRVVEPQVQVTKTFIEAGSGNPGTDITTGDAKDVFDVRVDVVNNGDAPAHNVQILDPLANTKYTYLGNVAGTDPPSSDGGITIPLAPPPSGAPGTNLPVFSWPANFTVDPGAGNAISFIYRVEGNDDFAPHEQVQNPIEAKWTSLEDNTVSLTGSIGTDGDVDGMRIGYFPATEAPPANAENDYLANDSDEITVPPLVFSKTDLNAADTESSIGELRQFQLVIGLPEGVTQNVRIDDDLSFGNIDPPVGIQTYRLENAAPFAVQYEFFGIREINDVVPTPANAETIFLGAPADGDTNLIWNIGKVETDTEDDSPLNATPAIAPRIRITYYARVNNDLVTNNNDVLQNEATLQYQNGQLLSQENIVQTTGAITVTEPVLNVTKVANVTTGDAGDLIQYTVTVSHDAASTAPAFDLNIVDTIPTNVTFENDISLQVNGVDVGNPVPLQSGQQLIWGRGNSNDDALDIPLGESLVLVYEVKIANTVQPLETITNSVVVDWTSINSASDGTTPEIDARERFGIGGADCSLSVAPNDYCAVPAVLPTVTIVDDNTVIKSKLNDSFNLGPAGTDVRIGDIIEYRLRIVMQEGTTRSLTISDTIPDGLEFLNIVSINGDVGTGVTPNIVYSDAATNFTYVGDGQILENTDISLSAIGPGPNVLTINIGDVIVDGDNLAATDNFDIIYRAVVTKNEFSLPQSATTAINNTAVIDYIDVLGNPPSGIPLSRLTSTLNLNVQEPIIFTANLVKDSPTINSGDAVGSNQPIDFRLLACNVGGGPAYDLVLVDNLPVELQHTSIINLDVDFTDATGTVELTQLTNTNEYTYTPPAVDGGDMIFTFDNVNAPLNANECIRVQFQIRVDSPIGANISWFNELRLDTYHSLDSDDPNADVLLRQDYAAAGPVIFNMNTVTPNNPPLKSLQSPLNGADPLHDEATIGEIITYQITVPSDDDDIVALPNPNPMTVDLFRVRVREQLDSHLTLIDATIDPASPYTQVAPLSVTPVGGNLFDIRLDPNNFLDASSGAVEPVLINVRARVNNDALTDTTVTDISNTASYFFTGSLTDLSEVSGGSVTTIADDDISVVEPQINLVSKAVSNITPGKLAADPPNAGDILQYTLSFNTSGGAANDIYSDAFDISIVDTLDPGLRYCSVATDGVPCVNPGIVSVPAGIGTMESDGTIIVSGTGVSGDPHIITWNVANNTDLDAVENSTVTVTYTVKVMDSVLANQSVDSSTLVSWTSLDGDFGVDERTYTATINSAPALTIPDVNSLTKALQNTSSILAGASDVRIGDVVDFELTLSLQEATSANLTLTDTLQQGLGYEGIVSVTANGITDNDGDFGPQPPMGFTAFNQTIATVVGDPRAGNSTVTFNLGDVVNAGNNITTDDELVIVYRTRVLDLVQTPLANPASNIGLSNSVDMVYGVDGGGTSDDLGNTVSVQIDQPNITVAKNFDPILLPAPAQDTVIESSEILNFTVDIINGGESPAYDLVVQDILPVGLRNGAAAPVITDIEMPIGVSILPGPLPVQSYNPVTGILIWNLDTGTANELTIPAATTMRIKYQVQADNNIGAGLSIDNSAQVLRYYSFDDDVDAGGAGVPLPPNPTTGATADTQIVPPEVDDREEYGPSNTDFVNLTTAGPLALDKDNNGNTMVSIGQPFTYTIQVPEIAVNTTLYDVKITDNLPDIPGASLVFLSASAINDDADISPDEDDNYIPVNTGTPKNLIIEDTLNGIEIPPNQTITVGLTVQVEDVADNINGVTFTNTADYTFNSIDNNPASQGSGLPDTTGIITIVEPVLEITKTGPSAPNTVVFNTPIPYRLVVENTGTGPAYDITITDLLPQVADNPPLPATPLSGGTCDIAPSNFNVAVYKDDELTLVNALDLGTDYTVTHTPRPTCELVITTLTPLAEVDDDEKLIITYDALLDVDSQNTAELTNTASVTEYFSQDTPAGVKVGQIRRYLNDPASSLDESSYTVVVEAPELVITKIPDNLTTGGSGASADPGDQLRYTINIQNNGPVPTGIFNLTDEPDRLNASTYFDFASIGNVRLNGVLLTAGVGYTTAGGVLNIPNLNLDALGGANDSLTIDFEIDLAPVITSGTTVVNQAQANVVGFSLLPSDDPSLPGADDPTETLIDAAPAFLVTKRSADITGDPAILNQGDTLRYTITVKNIGLENVNGAYLRDLVPANTAYVAGSTTLNGNPVADLANNASPLESELLINAPENTTPGFMRADADTAVTSNEATITFDVIVDADVVNGTVISNQGFVGGSGVGSGSFAEQPSDDPDTNLVNDPTIDVVGNLPAIDAQKTVTISTDIAGNGVVDNGDTLEYQIIIANGGAVVATEARLVDSLPANTSFVPGSVTLNGTSIPDTNLFPSLPTELDINLNSSDLGLPDQAANDGQITAGNEATVTFRVVAGPAPAVVAGDLIRNQGRIITNQLPEQLTDADGNSINGTQPTDIYVGANSHLTLTKEVFVVGGGVAQPGGQLEYVISVENTGLADATNIQLIDDIDGLDGTAIVSYQFGETKLDGSTSFIGSGVTEPAAPANDLLVDYQLAKASLESGEKLTVTYRVAINAGVTAGTEIRNTVSLDWTENPDTNPLTEIAVIEVGGAPGVGVLGGNVWHDVIRDTTPPELTADTDVALPNWIVQLYLVNPARTLFASTVSDIDGTYQFKGLPINSAGDSYDIRFIPPGGSDTSASMGRAETDDDHFVANVGVPGEMSISGINLTQGMNISKQNLPVIPHGVVYDSVLRTSVAGVSLRLLLPNGNLAPTACLPANSNQREQTTLPSGFYRFDIQSGSCANTEFVIEIDGVPSGYIDGTSVIIPPGKQNTTQIDVPACIDSADDMILGNADCDIQFSAEPPGVSVPVRTDSTRQGVSGESQGTTYYLDMRLSGGLDGQVAFKNHIPVDPELNSAIAISKVSAMVNVNRSQLVPYTITLTNTLAAPIYDLDVFDAFPAGFKYVAGSSRMSFANGPWVKVEPAFDPQVNSFAFSDNLSGQETSELSESLGLGLSLQWPDIGTLSAGDTVKIKLLLVVGSGVGEGEYTNRALVVNNLTNGLASRVASATVRVVPDPTFDCADVIGKVFDDKNMNAYQDEGEPGIPGARVITARGLEVTADKHGRFNIACAVVPNPDRGSNFILKLDERSLPTGYRLTTENPRVVRATRGKMAKFNFGAAIHRVVRLDMAEPVFEPGTTEMRPQWLPRLDLLITELAKDPSVLRLSYLAENETPSEVNDRLSAVKAEIEKRWEELNCCYQLTIETEVFWRKGGPPDRGEFDE